MSSNTPRIISVSTLEHELLGEEIKFSISPLCVIASSETKLASSGKSGFVDLATGDTMAQFDDWHDFTSRFMQYCQVFDFDPSYCRLALAMGKADQNRCIWEHYIDLARACPTHYFEMTDLRLTKKKSDLEATGWEFLFLSDHWFAQAPGIEIYGATLAETLNNIADYAIPTLGQWEQHVAKRGIRS